MVAIYGHNDVLGGCIIAECFLLLETVAGVSGRNSMLSTAGWLSGRGVALWGRGGGAPAGRGNPPHAHPKK